jgi:excisionase family DNA binding protein
MVTALFSVTKAADVLGISIWTVRGYIRNGMLIPVRIGRRVLLEEAELERFIAEAKSVSDSETRHFN